MAVQAPQNLIRKNTFSQRFMLWLIGLNRDILIQIFICAVITALFSAVFFSGIFSRFESVFLDFMHRMKPSFAVDQIIFIEVDDRSLLEIKERPWPRKKHAELLNILKEWGARAVVFESVFDGKTNPAGDIAFQEALKKSSRVYLPTLISGGKKRKVLSRSLNAFEIYSDGTGHINLIPDNDGVLRRFYPFLEADGKLVPHIALQLVYDLLGRPLKSPSDLRTPPDKDGALMIAWPGKWQRSFKHYSYVLVLQTYDRLSRKERPFYQPSEFKDKICVIGNTSAGGRFVATPLDKACPAIGVLASVMNGALTSKFIYPAGLYFSFLFFLAAAAASIFAFTPFRNFYSLIWFFVITGTIIAVSFFLFFIQGIWLMTLQPLLITALLFGISALLSKSVSDRERQVFYQLSTTDGLTGVAVRRYFDLIFSRAFKTSQRFKLPVSVVLMDIDHFKKINDTYGHQAGDEVLRKIAELIRKGIRFHEGKVSGDLVARYGGEEFILMLSNTDLKSATFNVAERIRKAIEVIPVEWEDQTIKITVSLGVACVHDFDQSPDQVVKRADEALYRSKENGRNRTSIESFDQPSAE